MVFAKVRDRVIVACGEVADVQTYPKLRGHLQQFPEALDRCNFVRIVHLGVSMERGPYFVSFDKRNQSRPHGYTSLISLKEFNPQFPHLPKHRIDFRIGNIVGKSV